MSRCTVILLAFVCQPVVACGSGDGSGASASEQTAGTGPRAAAGASGCRTTDAAGSETERAGAGGSGADAASGGMAGEESGVAGPGIADDSSRAGAGGEDARVSGGTAGASSFAGASGEQGCEDACSQGSVCLRGACISDCGADLDAMDEALADGVAVVAHLCRTPAAFGISQDADTERLTVYELSAEAGGESSSTLTVSSWPVDPAVSDPVAVPVFSSTVTDPDGVFPTSLFLSGYVAVDGTRARAAIGYTNLAFGGLLLVGDTASGNVQSLDAPGNYGAAWVEAGALLVNGLGAGNESGGQGLYWISTSGEQLEAVNVATHVSTYSGAVAVDQQEGVVFAGGSTLDSEQFFVLPLDRLRDVAFATATEAVDASTDPDVQSLELPSNFDLLSDRRLLTRQFTAYPALDVDVVEWSLSQGKVVPSMPRAVSRGEVFSSAIAGGRRILLQHSAGLLLVDLD